MLEKLMAKLGHGAAEVELYLPKEVFKPGEHLRGELVVQGGKVEQRIDSITVALVKGMDAMEVGGTSEVEQIPIAEAFTIAAEETRTFLFDYTLPLDAEHAYYLITKLQLEGAVNDYDQKRIHIGSRPPKEPEISVNDPILNQPMGPFSHRML
ncbi:sporulation protein [Ectobacillus sp. JY-23]|uniref:sporulation protein n=1 Tax=Ectobacillus sp. JY-23 TaxID=2933872 RepID=UPI001FF45CFB|nr:sporulation protein [Ectobacillus sp. JY-23]UOY92436.1 sporulation protein [Ectobacillus sp. JY-23]